MEIPSKYYDRNKYGIDPRTIVAGYFAQAGFTPTEAQQGTKRFIANDWDRTGSYVVVANTVEFMRPFFQDHPGLLPVLSAEDDATLQRYSAEIRRGDWAMMENVVGAAIHYIHEQRIELGGEPFHPKRHYMEGPFVTADVSGEPLLDPEDPGLWALFKAESYVRRNGYFGALYHKRGEIYVPAEYQPYLHLQPFNF